MNAQLTNSDATASAGRIIIYPNNNRPIIDSQRRDRARGKEAGPRKARGGFAALIAELSRRRVCRAITTYAIVMWLICQVVELVYEHLGLPEWTLKLVIVIGILGLPIALVLAWMFDITPDGVVADGVGSRNARADASATPRGIDRFIDCGLVLTALFIAAHLVVGGLTTDATADQPANQKVAVQPFRAASSNGAEMFAEGLIAELQHELARLPDVTVVVPNAALRSDQILFLTGAVAMNDTVVRVTVTLTHSESGEVIWSDAFDRDRTKPESSPVGFARAISSTLQFPAT